MRKTEPLAPRRVAEVVAAHPGRTRSAVARLLGGRRATAWAAIEQALADELVHVAAASAVASAQGHPREVEGLYPGAAPARLAVALPAVDVDGLRDLLEQAGVRPADLARSLGISPPLVFHWLAGRSRIPEWVQERLDDALQAAQQARIPRAGGRRRMLTEMLQIVHRQPGISRWQLTRNRRRRTQLLEQALDAGHVHEAPAYANAQPVLGIYPGPKPATAPRQVLVADLHAARVAAGWSQEALARRMGLSRPAVARWERELTTVPTWAAEKAHGAMEVARMARRDDAALDEARVLAVLDEAPGLSEKQLLARLGHSQHAATMRAAIGRLLDDGRAHTRHAGTRGHQLVLHPGPQPSPVLTPAQLRDLRTRAGLTQTQLATAVGAEPTTLTTWERGSRPMSLEWQRRLLEHLERCDDAGEQLRAAVVDALPATFHQLDQLGLAGRQTLRQVLEELVTDGRAHQGRVGAGAVDPQGRVSRGRAGYLPGPSAEATEPALAACQTRPR